MKKEERQKKQRKGPITKLKNNKNLNNKNQIKVQNQ